MTIDGNISDLFFNTDLDAAAMHDQHGQFTGWDHEALRAEAEMFLGCLQRLGIEAPPADDLIADLFARI